jgi:nucleotide-binding universal stress UspA family protein
MSYRTLMVIVDDDPGLSTRLECARLLAQRFDAFVRGLHVMPLPIVPVGYGEAAAYVGPELIEAQRQANRQTASRLEARFNEALADLVPAIEWRLVEGEPALVAVEQARTVDLTIAARSRTSGLEALEPDVAEHLAMGAGGPVLVLPLALRDPDVGRKIIVGWNGSRQACRALHDALPLLGVADSVTLLAIGTEEDTPDFEDALAMVRRHGVEVEPVRIAAEGSVGKQLLYEAGQRGADLLVIGAYGHSRLRELVLGGATREVLEEAELALFLAS